MMTMIKKIQILWFTLLAVFAFGAFAAASAFAEELPQWLVNGAAIALGEQINADILPGPAGKERLLIEDMNASTKPDLLCEVVNSLMWLLSNGEGEVVSGECPAPVVDAGTCGSPKVKPVNLPWRTELLEPGVNVYVLHILKIAAGNPGWEAECTVLGVKITDVCTAADRLVALFPLADGLVEGEFKEELEEPAEAANCTIGGAQQGLVAGVGLIHALNNAGELLPLALSLLAEVI
jgi:hypothetical protein